MAEKIIFEELEPRILLSATMSPAITDIAAIHVDLGTERTAEKLSLEIVFIDENVENSQEIIEALKRNTEVIYISSDENGIHRISEILDQRQKISGIHIFSHGRKGEIFLGNAILSSATFKNYADGLRTWGRSLTEEGDLYIYGCNIGEDLELMEDLSFFTGADVAASDDLTGAESLGGDWDLEVTVGEVEASLFSQVTEHNPNLLLAAPVLDTSGNPKLTDIDKNEYSSVGNTVGEIVIDGSITDDYGSVEAIVVTSADNNNGTWQSDKGTGWKSVRRNLALEGVASQSSTYETSSFAYTASAAIDGNSDGTWGNKSVSGTQKDFQAYWEVQLSGVFLIDEINLYNRSTFQSRLSDFTIEVFKGAVEVHRLDIPGALGDSMTFSDFAVFGDRLRVTLNGTNYLSLAEVEIFGSEILSSTDKLRFVPDRGFAGQATFHFRAYDGVDLSIAEESASITVVPNFVPVLATNGKYELSGIVPNDLSSLGDTVGEILIDGSITDLDGEVETIVVTSSDNSNGYWQSDRGTGWQSLRRNLALEGVARQSSDYALTSLATAAIDGNPDGTWSNRSVSGTKKDIQAFWEVELTALALIDEIYLYNRSTYASRLRDFTITVFNGSVEVHAINYSTTVGVSEVFSGFSILGDRVRITLNGTNYLSLAEVEVFGREVLSATDRLRFVPTMDYEGQASFSFRAYDGTDLSLAEARAFIEVGEKQLVKKVAIQDKSPVKLRRPFVIPANIPYDETLTRQHKEIALAQPVTLPDISQREQNTLAKEVMDSSEKSFSSNIFIEKEVVAFGSQSTERVLNAYATPLGEPEKQELIEDLLEDEVDEEQDKVDKEVSYITDEEALLEQFSELKYESALTQKKLDNRANLEDTWNGCFDCLKYL